MRPIRRRFCLYLALICLSAGGPAAQEAGPEVPAGEDTAWEDFDDFGEGEGLVVTAARDTPAQIRVIAKEEIDRIAAPDIPTLLEEALDLGITRHGAYGNSADVNLRGFDTERIAILVDGVPVNSAMSGDFDFNTLDMNNIERIEVIYGGSDSKYNVTGALGGVINIITIKDRPAGLHFEAGISNLSYIPGNYTEWDGTKRPPQWQDLADTQKLELSLSYGAPGKEGAGAFSVGAHVFGNRAGNHYLYKDSFLGQIRRKQFNEVQDAGGGALAAWNFTNLSRLIFSVDAYYSDKNIPATGFSSVIGVQNDLTTRESLLFEAPVIFRDDLAMELSVSHSWARMDYDREGMTFSRHDQQGMTLINRWAWYPLAALTLRAGGDYRYIRLDSTGIGNRNRNDGGLYLTAEYRPVKAFSLIPSIKVVTDGKSIVPAPKLGFVWAAGDRVTVKNNYFRSFKYPDFEDLYWSGGGSRGNPDLKSEDGWGTDLGAEFRWKDLLSAESTLFAQYTKDSIHWHKAAGGYWEPENIGEAAFFGWDTRLKSIFSVSWGPVKKISPALSYQLLQSYLLSYGYTWRDRQRIPYQPEHTIGASADVSWGTGSALLSAHYESVRYYSVTNLVELAPYLLVNLNVNQTLGKHLTVFTALRNLLNQSYESYNRYPMPAFNMTTGVKLSI
ncbi:MAG: TonB-dependent receptor [Treponema sp.]|jgi:vitamin B12 transporter|nr:TonB-dependent receptor [Treponema sp.]